MNTVLKKLIPEQPLTIYASRIAELQYEIAELKIQLLNLGVLTNDAFISSKIKEASTHYINVNDQGVIHRIPTENIIMLMAVNNYTYIYLVDGSHHFTSKTLHHWVSKIEGDLNFFRCHRSYFINLHKISKIQMSSNDIQMYGDLKAKYSRNMKKQLFDLINLD